MAQATFRAVVNPDHGNVVIPAEISKNSWLGELTQPNVSVEKDGEMMVEFSSSLTEHNYTLMTTIPQEKRSRITEKDVYTITVEA